MFHIDYSGGTAAVRGNVKMHKDQYYWEIKMTTPVYGTDMVCIGDLDPYQSTIHGIAPHRICFTYIMYY
jgi:SPRY domain-containing SOCS box protein 3